MPKKKTNKCVCHECDVELDITIVSSLDEQNKNKLLPEICPFCGDCLDMRDSTPLLNSFDDLDEFDEEDYYDDDEVIDDDEDG